jgi:hypothetical protein
LGQCLRCWKKIGGAEGVEENDEAPGERGRAEAVAEGGRGKEEEEEKEGGGASAAGEKE